MLAPAHTHSIRRALLARLMGPLVLIVVLGGASAYALSRHFTQVVLDHWLYDSAISLANRVKWENGHATVDLPEGAREILEWDVVDRIYYEVISESGAHLMGNAFIPPPPQVFSAPVYYDARLAGADVRVLVVTVRSPGGDTAQVRVAETLHKRVALAKEVLWISVVLCFALAIVSALVIRYAIGSGISSMVRVIRKICSVHADAPLTSIAIGADVPEEVHPLVHELNGVIANLAQVHQLNQRFIADAAHQLRTPLASLRLQLEIALREKDAELHARAVDDAVAVLTRMGRTVHQLLTLARADDQDAAVEVPHAMVDIARLGREAVEARIDDAVAAGVDLGFAGSQTPVLVPGSADLLREALANLVDNALRYGAPKGRVTVGVAAERPELYVEDDGPGIDPDERAKVCQRFYRIRGSAGDGCGLGLAIVSEIVRRHGGTLALEPGANGVGLRARMLFGREASAIQAAA